MNALSYCQNCKCFNEQCACAMGPTHTLPRPVKRSAGDGQLHGLDGLLALRHDCMSALTCLYLAVDKRIADDVNSKVRAYVRALEPKQPIAALSNGGQEL